jgi:hypothetical protein
MGTLADYAVHGHCGSPSSGPWGSPRRASAVSWSNLGFVPRSEQVRLTGSVECAGLTAVRGLLISPLAGDGLDLHPSGLIGSRSYRLPEPEDDQTHWRAALGVGTPTIVYPQAHGWFCTRRMALLPLALNNPARLCVQCDKTVDVSYGGIT